jgi:hypothetical protein
MNALDNEKVQKEIELETIYTKIRQTLNVLDQRKLELKIL